MQFEIANALRDLDRRTNSYIRDEIFAHGDLTVRKTAIEALTNLDPARRTAKVLAVMLDVLPSSD